MNLTFEQIRNALPNLVRSDQRRLFDELAKLIEVEEGQPASPPSDNDLSSSQKLNALWLEANANLYRGQWVALKDGDLIASSADGKAFVQAVRDSGVISPFLLLISGQQGKDVSL